MTDKSWYEDRPEFIEAKEHIDNAGAALAKLAGAYIETHPNEPVSIIGKYAMLALAEIQAKAPGKRPASVAEQLVLAEAVLAPEIIAKLRKSATNKDGTLRDDDMTRTILRLVIKANTTKGKKS